MFLPALNKAKLKAQNASALSNLKQIGMAAQIAAVDNNGRLPATLNELTNNHLLSEKILTDPVSGKQFVFAGGGETLDSLASNAFIAYSPENKKGRAVLLADGSVQIMSRTQFDDLERRTLYAPAAPSEIANARREVAENSQSNDKLASDRPVLTVAAPVVSGGTIALSGVNGSVGGVNNFTPQNQGLTVGNATPAAAPVNQLFKDAARAKAEALGVSNSQRFRNATANTVPVLVSFELQQNGNSVAVVDADGSVYQGSLLTNNLVSQNHVLTAVLRGTTQNQVSPGAKKEDVAGNNYYFRVSGQNRTSKQNVVFSGNLIPLAGGAVNSQVAPSVNNSAVHGEMSQPQNAALFSNSRIAGTATVNTTNKIEINAMPTTP